MRNLGYTQPFVPFSDTEARKTATHKTNPSSTVRQVTILAFSSLTGEKLFDM
jgi:hypothetical protein